MDNITDKRAQEINNSIYLRNVPSVELRPNLAPRSVSTKYSTLPIIDRRRVPKEKMKEYQDYNVSTTFNPGNDSAPWSGFSSNVNLESVLRNQFFALQKCDRADYVPSSGSDLFIDQIPENKPSEPNLLMFESHPNIEFNPNPLNLGKETFNNFTRYQLKNLSL